MRLGITTALLLLVAVPATPAAAQVGIAAGGLYSDAAVKLNDVEIATDYRVGLQAGVSYATGGVFGVIVGGYYSQKGFDVAGSSETAKLAYVDVPVMGVVRLPILERTIGPRVYGGVDGAFQVSCSTEGSGFVLGDLCDNTSEFDFGLKGGLGIQVLFVGLDFSYTYGLTDVASDSALEINNRAWSLALIFGVG